MINFNNIIKEPLTIFEALKKMDNIKRKILFFTDENNNFLGLISLGDIQRSIIKNCPLDTPVKNIFRKKEHITFATIHQSFEDIKNIMIQNRVEAMPVLNDDGILEKIIFWEDIIPEKELKNFNKLNLPVVIMAGGFGTRLKPLTNVIPKALIPLGGKTILEEIMDNFLKFSCDKFYISVNYKSDLIQYYFNTQTKAKYDIYFLKELNPLGTAGGLSLLKGVIDKTFFVSNCDIIIKDDYSKIYDYHKDNKNELTIVAALKSFKIPYGTISAGENGILQSIDEKPEITFKINTGLYILEPHLIEEIPDKKFFHITELINKLNNEKRRVGVFPISEGAWLDIGNWKEYLEQIKF
jgi:dTDP-glucose pyrophosphorylase